MPPPTSQNHEVDILIVDDTFPHPLSAFRMQEFVSYLGAFDRLKILTTGASTPMLGPQSPAEVLADFRQKHPQYAEKVEILIPGTRLQTRFMYMTFLGNAYQHLATIEQAEVPFAFTLYPGGWFRLHNPRSDEMLARVTASPCFRKVIVTQKITYEYLLEKRFCTPDQIEYLFGVVTPLGPVEADYPGKLHFGFGKDTLDICFSAHKYTEKGVDKGYDIFIETARLLSRKYANIRFHVVGGFDEHVLEVGDFREKITFHGTREMAWFDAFYQDKDIILSPNIPFTIIPGAFDGFPTGTCVDAGLRQTALFCTDELKQNTHFSAGEELVIIPHDAAQIASLIEAYYHDPQKLKALAENGQRKIRQLYGFEGQIQPRLRLLKAELERARLVRTVILQPSPMPGTGSRQPTEQQLVAALTTVKNLSPAWFRNLLKKADAKIRSNRSFFNFIKRHTPEFILRLYLKLRGLS